MAQVVLERGGIGYRRSGDEIRPSVSACKPFADDLRCRAQIRSATSATKVGSVSIQITIIANGRL